MLGLQMMDWLGAIGSLKVSTTGASSATPVAPSAGLLETKDGAVVSGPLVPLALIVKRVSFEYMARPVAPEMLLVSVVVAWANVNTALFAPARSLLAGIVTEVAVPASAPVIPGSPVWNRTVPGSSV